MLLAKSSDSLEGCCLKGVHETVSNNLYLNRRPLKGRVLGNSDSGTATRDSGLRKLTALVLGWIWVVENMKCIPQDLRKTFPV
jgi:hypothetical protein